MIFIPSDIATIDHPMPKSYVITIMASLLNPKPDRGVNLGRTHPKLCTYCRVKSSIVL